MRGTVDDSNLPRAIEEFTETVEGEIAQTVELATGEELETGLRGIAELLRSLQATIARVWLPVVRNEIALAEKQSRGQRVGRSPGGSP